jgi:hypothetical protein
VTADSHSPSAPLAIRITRPYATEDDYLEQELDTLTRASITLIGAQPRPEGAMLRFELVLTSGQVLLRGEGRVTGFKPNAHQGLGGLSLRFTRLDSRSKALLDKAAALRDRRRPSLRPASLTPDSPREPPVFASVAPSIPSPVPQMEGAAARNGLHVPPPAEAAVESAAFVPAAAVQSPAFLPAPAAVENSTFVPAPAAGESRVPSPAPVESPAFAAAVSPANGSVGPLAQTAGTVSEPPADPYRPDRRDALLERLRIRARGLPSTAIVEILDRTRNKA